MKEQPHSENVQTLDRHEREKNYFKIWTLTNALKTHIYRHELQQEKGIVIGRCPFENFITIQKGTQIHKNRKR